MDLTLCGPGAEVEGGDGERAPCGLVSAVPFLAVVATHGHLRPERDIDRRVTPSASVTRVGLGVQSGCQREDCPEVKQTLPPQGRECADRARVSLQDPNGLAPA
ncbi:hypothetical protein GCM10010230_08990 [Streptomyces narbonensis]|nr:hypothetical protein GCM10010230_08990 [Streptomyces narbonensis]